MPVLRARMMLGNPSDNCKSLSSIPFLFLRTMPGSDLIQHICSACGLRMLTWQSQEERPIRFRKAPELVEQGYFDFQKSYADNCSWRQRTQGEDERVALIKVLGDSIGSVPLIVLIQLEASTDVQAQSLPTNGVVPTPTDAARNACITFIDNSDPTIKYSAISDALRIYRISGITGIGEI